MTDTFHWAVALSGATVAVWALLIFFIPNCMCSMFRYRLWRLRDTVKDDVLRGQLPDSGLTQEFLGGIEAFILVADKVTLIQMLLLPSDAEESQRRRKLFEEAVRLLKDEHQVRFLAYREEFKRVLLKRLLFGSLTGWGFLTLLLPAILLSLIVALVQRASVSMTDLTGRVFNWIEGATKRFGKGRPSLGLPDVTEKVMVMQAASPRSLTECAG